MAGIHIVTDSACDISTELADSHGITIVSLTIRFGDEEFEDGKDLSPGEFWQRCAHSTTLPETAAPSPGAFQQAFQKASDSGAEGVLCLTLSSSMSATFASAKTASEAFDKIPVQVLDTRSVTMGQGLLVLSAATEAQAGATMDELVNSISARIERTRVYGVVGGLEHLQRGGRIGGAQALLGSLLSIKPVVQVKEGVVAEESKQRTRSKALSYLIDKVTNEGRLERLAIANGASEDIDQITERLSGIELDFPLISVDLGPVVGSHTGPSTVGICYVLPPTNV